MDNKIKNSLHVKANEFSFNNQVNIQDILNQKKRKKSKLFYILIPVATNALLLFFIIFLNFNQGDAPTISVNPVETANNAIMTLDVPSPEMQPFSTKMHKMVDSIYYQGNYYYLVENNSYEVLDEIGIITTNDEALINDGIYSSHLPINTAVYKTSDDNIIAVKVDNTWYFYNK